MIDLLPADLILVHRKWRGWWEELFPNPLKIAGYFASRQIQKESDSPFNHVALVHDDIYLLEAQSQVQRALIEKYLDEEKYGVIILHHRYLTLNQRYEIAAWAQERLGEDYDYGFIFRAWLKGVLINKGIFGAIELKDNYPDKWVCSEFVQEAYKAAGKTLSKYMMYPADFPKLIRSADNGNPREKPFDIIYSNFDYE